MYNVVDIVRTKAPFSESFPDEYAITDIVNNGDGTTVYILGDAGGFDAVYLEAV